MHEDKLKQILKKVNDLPDLNSSNVIKKIKDVLQKEDPDAYAVWEEKKCDPNFNFELHKENWKFNSTKRLNMFELAASADCNNVLKFLVEASKNQSSESIIDKKNADGKTLLHYAAESGAIETAKYLIKERAEVDAKDNDERTPLSWAAAHGTKEIVQLLIDEKANINAKGGEAQSTPLIFAIKFYRKDIVQLLIEMRANVDAKDNNGRAPLFWAVGLGHRDIVQLLIKMRADVNTKGKYERTPLFWAAMDGDKEMVQLLINKGANVDAKDNDGRTSLFLAALRGDKEMVQLLLDKKADIREKNDKNQSLLHLAVIEENIDAVRILLEEGLNPNEKDKNGKNPMDLAQDSNIKWALEYYIPKKLYRAVLRRNPDTANKILNNCRNNDNIAEVLPFPLRLFLTKKQVAELSKQDNKDIIKAMQKTQAVDFACGGGIAAVIGIPIAIALPSSYAMTPDIITVTTIAGAAGFIGLLCIGFAVFHALKEFPSAQVNETRSTKAGAEAPIPG